MMTKKKKFNLVFETLEQAEDHLKQWQNMIDGVVREIESAVVPVALSVRLAETVQYLQYAGGYLAQGQDLIARAQGKERPQKKRPRRKQPPGGA